MRIFYSKNAINNLVYRLKVKNEADGSVTIERDIVNGHNNITEQLHFIDEQIPYSVDQNTLTLNPVSGRTVWIISFHEDAPICEVVSGGPKREYYCQSGCNSDLQTCILDNNTYGNNSGQGYSVGCSGTCVSSCKIKYNTCSDDGSTAPSPSGLTNSGSIAIIATTINFAN